MCKNGLFCKNSHISVYISIILEQNYVFLHKKDLFKDVLHTTMCDFLKKEEFRTRISHLIRKIHSRAHFRTTFTIMWPLIRTKAFLATSHKPTCPFQQPTWPLLKASVPKQRAYGPPVPTGLRPSGPVQLRKGHCVSSCRTSISEGLRPSEIGHFTK